MKKKLDGTYRAFEVRRTLPDIVQFVVYLGVGREHHAATYRRVYSAFRHKQRYKELTFEDFTILMQQVNGRKHSFWEIETTGDVVAVR